MLANEFCPEKEEKVFITRPNSDTETAWKSAADAKYMLTIKDTCDKHVEEADKTKPVIKLNGSSTITINVGDSFTDPGATATDDRDGELTDKITTAGSVNTSKAGTYKITYTVEDSAGNKATVTRTVIVKGNNNTGGNTGGNTTGNTVGNNIDNNEVGNNVTGEGNNVVDNTTT